MASSLSDKAIFIYDTFFSADITQGQLDSQIKQSSLFRIAFEEVISYPNLLDKMKAHDRYDELIGINTEAYDMISDNATREENSQLEANAFLFITNEDNDNAAFNNFLNTVSGHIGFGKIINNPRTAYEIASNSHAVDLILANDDAVAALLNAPNGLTAFGKDAISAQKIFSRNEIFTTLRSSLRFNQYQVLPAQPDNISHRVKYVGGKYIVVDDGNNYIMVSDDMYNWTKVLHPDGHPFRSEARCDSIGFDPINRAWFFHTKVDNEPPVYTKDFVTWNDVSGAFGNSYGTTMTYFGGKIWCNYRNSANAWKIGFISLSENQEYYSITELASQPGWMGHYGVSPEFSGVDGDYPYMMWTDAGYAGSYMNKNGIYNTRSRATGNSSWFYLFDNTESNYRGQRSLTFANDNFYLAYYYSRSGSNYIGISKFTFTADDFESGDNSNSNSVGRSLSYWYHTKGTTVIDVVYKNGVYIASYPNGYATSLNGVVWDIQLFDVTYEFRITDVDERGFVGWVPGTDFVLTSYDATVNADVENTTTTSTTTAAPSDLPEGISELECLIDTTEATVVKYNGDKMVFNDKDYYENTNYVVTNGDYKILNVPADYPIAVLNKGKEQKITYTGDLRKKHFIKTNGTDADSVYDFYYGDVTIKVRDNFETISLYYYKKPTAQGYIGMEKILVHQDYLTAEGTTASDTTSKVSDTTIYASSIRNFDCVGNEALEDTDIVRVGQATTSTTTSTPRNSKILPYQEVVIPTTTAFPHTITNLPEEVAITFDGSGNVVFNGIAYNANTRYGLEEGTYIFTAPDDDPIAIVGATTTGLFGSQESQISYSGDFYKRSVKSVDGTPHYFYHGEIIVIVDGDFGQVGFYRYNENSYAGGQDIFKYSPISHTSTTTLPLTTSTTTSSATDYTFCITEEQTITASNGYYLFDNRPYVSNEKIGLTNGTYVLRNVPQSHPIAILNYGNWSNISYSGEPMKSISHTAPDGHMYNYYYGDITVQVSGNFGVISYDCSNHGYMGGQDRLVFDDTCPVISVIPTTSTTTLITPTTTEIPNSLIETTTTIIPTTLEPTTTSSTTVATTAQYCLSTAASGNTATYGGGQYIFNGNYGLYGMTTGTYVFKNISASHPIAFLNYGKTNNITYSGQYAGGSKQAQDGYQYTYYYGDVTVTVTGDFGFLSYECLYHGYMGGENNIIYDNTTCN